MSDKWSDSFTKPEYSSLAGNIYNTDKHKRYSNTEENANSEPLLTAQESKSAVGGLFWGIVITAGLVYGLAWLSSVLN